MLSPDGWWEVTQKLKSDFLEISWNIDYNNNQISEHFSSFWSFSPRSSVYLCLCLWVDRGRRNAVSRLYDNRLPNWTISMSKQYQMCDFEFFIGDGEIENPKVVYKLEYDAKAAGRGEKLTRIIFNMPVFLHYVNAWKRV